MTDIPNETEYTGRFIITFREGATVEALGLLKKSIGISKSKLISSLDFLENGVDIAQVPDTGGVIFEHLGIAVVSMVEDKVAALSQSLSDESAILAIEPEEIMYALPEINALSLEYLRGFRDASDLLYSQAKQGTHDDGSSEDVTSFQDSATLTWGLQATKVAASKYSGKDIRVAILDTGLDLKHPDFSGRSIKSKSFISGVTSAQDGHGHGTHCTGTACGTAKPKQGPRYGIAYGAQIYIGKVLSDQGSGGDMGILAGIDWAIANGCHIVSMSLGSQNQNTSVAYETAGQRTLNAGTLIVAAASNNANRSAGNFGFVGRPANSRSFLAVGALDSNLKIANFSARDTVRGVGTAVDIAGPGVDIYSSVPMPTRYRNLSGTSMATPHVAGIAALWAQATPDRGEALWHRLITNARTISLPIADVGRGLVRAP